MTEEQKAAFIMAQAAVLYATVSGMVAENMVRASKGESLAYGEDAFQAEIDRSSCHHNTVVTFFQQ